MSSRHYSNKIWNNYWSNQPETNAHSYKPNRSNDKITDIKFTKYENPNYNHTNKRTTNNRDFQTTIYRMNEKSAENERLFLNLLKHIIGDLNFKKTSDNYGWNCKLNCSKISKYFIHVETLEQETIEIAVDKCIWKFIDKLEDLGVFPKQLRSYINSCQKLSYFLARIMEPLMEKIAKLSAKLKKKRCRESKENFKNYVKCESNKFWSKNKSAIIVFIRCQRIERFLLEFEQNNEAQRRLKLNNSYASSLSSRSSCGSWTDSFDNSEENNYRGHYNARSKKNNRKHYNKNAYRKPIVIESFDEIPHFHYEYTMSGNDSIIERKPFS